MGARNDGNKIYKILEASKSKNGPVFRNYGQYLASHFELSNFDAMPQMYVKVDISIDQSKHV